MKQIEKIQALADKYGYNLATNLGLNEAMKLILSKLSDDEIKHFYIDTFMLFSDEVDKMYEELNND